MFKSVSNGVKQLFKNRSRAVFFLLAAGAIAVFALWKIRSNTSSQPQYQTATATKGTLVTSVTASGTITSGGSVDVTTSATGIVSKVYVKDGDSVVTGQKIADITLDQNAQQRQAAAYANYLGAQSSLSSAQSKMNSLQAALFKANQAFLTDRGVANPTDGQKADPVYIEENATWLQAEADYKNQQQVISQAQSALSSSWLSYLQNSSTIVAPTSGVVSNLTVAEGVAITSSSNTSSSISSQELGKVTVPGAHLQATVSLSEIDSVNVKPDQKATLTLDAFSGKTFTGKVLIVDTNGAVSSGVTTYPTVISFDDSLPNIYPNMAVTANIITSVKDNVILVPSGAVQTSGGQTTVQILKNGQVTSVDVTAGDSNDTETEIVSGVNDGDVVVTGTASSASTSQTGTSSPFGALGGRGIGGFGGGGAVRRVGGG